MPKPNYQMTNHYNPVLFKTLLKYLQPQKNERILDLGCGQGRYVKKIEDYTDFVLGVDRSEIAIKKTVTPKVEIGDVTNLRFDVNSFDKIYSLHTIEHILNIKKFFSEAARVLKPDGEMILIYPWEPIRGLQAMVAAIKNYRNPLKARKIHLHKLDPNNIKKAFQGTSFTHVKSKFIFALGFHYLTILRKTH